MIESRVWLVTISYYTVMLLRPYECILSEFSFCHDDIELYPRDGLLDQHTFGWLGFAQYLHVTTDLPHTSKAPRVVLIHKRFALGTAYDLVNIPRHYKLGRVVFGDYERDEEECKLTELQIKMGMKCPRAFIEMPISDIIPHPEFLRFGMTNSLAIIVLLQPIKSDYMMPICLPSYNERLKLRGKTEVFLVDYVSTVPKDFSVEKMAKRTVKLFTDHQCRRQRMKTRLGNEGVTHLLCTSGCGVRIGTPLVIHNEHGPFELIGMAVGGAVCSKRRHRSRFNTDPPIFVDVYPYYNWILNVITANLMPKPYPTYHLTGVYNSSRRSFYEVPKKVVSGWKSRTYSKGRICFKSSKILDKYNVMFFFERFQAKAPGIQARLNVFMKMIAPIDYSIVCVRLKLPNRRSVPLIHGVMGHNISIQFSTESFPNFFTFSLQLLAKNESSMWLFHTDIYKQSYG